MNCAIPTELPLNYLTGRASLYGCDDEMLAAILKKAQDVLAQCDSVGEWHSRRRSDAHLLQQDVFRVRQNRLIEAGATNLDWHFLLWMDLSDTITGQSMLAAALAQFELYATHSSFNDADPQQHIVAVKLRRNDTAQRRKIKNGIEILLPHISPVRGVKLIKILRDDKTRGGDNHHFLEFGNSSGEVRVLANGAKGVAFRGIASALQHAARTLFYLPAPQKKRQRQTPARKSLLEPT